MSPQRKARLARTSVLASFAILWAVDIASGTAWLLARVAWQIVENVFWIGN